MNMRLNRKDFLKGTASLVALAALPAGGQTVLPSGRRDGHRRPDATDYVLPADLAEYAACSVILGRVTNESVTVSILARDAMDAFIEYGAHDTGFSRKTDIVSIEANEPTEIALNELFANTEYAYRLKYRKQGDREFTSRAASRFATQRAVGSTFSFGVQGDTHPERPQMSDPTLYARTLQNANEQKHDFYLCMGDDFSVDTLQTINPGTVRERYTLQRPFLGLVAQSAPLFLVNGNHEQASLYNFNQTDTRHDVAVLAQTSRNKYYPMPEPDIFYTGDTKMLSPIGLLRDYYAWAWGDALFIVLDNYWHSHERVDNAFHEQERGGNDHQGNKDRNWWEITLGDEQYEWFKTTLEESNARFKFVFAHHVLGTGRGGIEEADLYEWGGESKRGDWEFGQHRPGWQLPIHSLMVKHKVTIFFQGHDHLYARQERDGVVYQEVPMPADQAYETRNDDRYDGIKRPNSGHLSVTVAPTHVTVDYIRAYLPVDETNKQKTGEIAYSYTIKAEPTHA